MVFPGGMDLGGSAIGTQLPILSGRDVLNWIDLGDLSDSSSGSECPARAETVRSVVRRFAS
jgi:hypothetical protein